MLDTTHGMVATPFKDYGFVALLLEMFINSVISKRRVENGMSLTSCWFEEAETVLRPHEERLVVKFVFDGRKYQLLVNFAAESTANQLDEPLLTLEMERFRDSEMLMRTALRALSCLGTPALFSEKFQDPRWTFPCSEEVSLIQCCADGLSELTTGELNRWIRAFESVHPKIIERGLGEFLGISDPLADMIIKADSAAQKNALLEPIRALLAENKAI